MINLVRVYQIKFRMVTTLEIPRKYCNSNFCVKSVSVFHYGFWHKPTTSSTWVTKWAVFVRKRYMSSWTSIIGRQIRPKMVSNNKKKNLEISEFWWFWWFWKYRNVKIPKCEIPKCENTEMWKYRNVKIPKCENTEMWKYRNVKIPKCGIPCGIWINAISFFFAFFEQIKQRCTDGCLGFFPFSGRSIWTISPSVSDSFSDSLLNSLSDSRFRPDLRTSAKVSSSDDEFSASYTQFR